MGQDHSGTVKFNDIYRASDINSRGRIKCNTSCTFTQYSASSYSTDCESSVTCKIYESKHDTVAFGLVPEQEAERCVNNMVGDREIYGSIGCQVTRDTVMLVKGDKRFFNGAYEAGEYFTITLKIRHGVLTFLVDGNKVDSKELENMSFKGRYKLGVAMVRSGQEAEVYFDCPVSFLDTWSAGSVNREMLIVKKSTNFTFFSEQVVSPSGGHKIVANVLRNCSNSVGLGLVPVDSKNLCQSNLVGMMPGMIGCIFKDGQVFVAINGDVVFASNVNTSNPCVLTMTLEDGHVSFQFDGGSIVCEELKSLRLTQDFRVGVGLSSEGQIVEMRGDGRVVSTLSKGGSKGSREDDLLEKLVDILREAGLGSSSDSNDVSWADNMRSIDCDNGDHVAVCVKKFTATLHSKCVVSASAESSVDVRVLSLKPGQLLMIGVLNDDTTNHSTSHLGSAEMRNSLGLTSRGDLLIDGSTRETGRTFRQGDLISMSINGGKLSIKINGIEAIPELDNYNFEQKFRWGVSFTDLGQAVKIGGEDLTPDETAFCLRKGVQADARGSSTSTAATCSIKSTVSSGTARTANSFDDSITGCHIDVEDLTFGGKPLGSGTFGSVYKGKWDGYDVAVKKLPWDEDDSQRREIAVGRSLAHPNIATIKGWSRKDDSLLVVMPLFRKGSLADRISKVGNKTAPTPSTGGHFGFEFTFNVGLGLLRAIKYMASRKPDPMIHRDIKPANVLLDENDQPMLTDFGTARSLHASAQGALTTCGTPLYMAAEQANKGAASTATDVHAVALVIYEVLCAPRLGRASTVMWELMQEIVAGKVPPMHDVPRDIARVLTPAFNADPGKRPTAKQMIASLNGISTVYETSYEL